MKLSTKITTGMAALLLAVSLGAGAKIKGTESAVRVDLSDLDLATEVGIQVMKNRVKRAAKQVCGPHEHRTAGSLENARRNKACFDEAVVSAVSAVELRYATAYVDVFNAR